jgi:hypothetical protein
VRPLALALTLLALPSPSAAQLHVEVDDCDPASPLRAALELELDGASDAESTRILRVELDCEALDARLRVEDLASRVHVERLVSLRETPAHLRERFVALVARELVDAARVLAPLPSDTAPRTQIVRLPVAPEPVAPEPVAPEPGTPEPGTPRVDAPAEQALPPPQAASSLATPLTPRVLASARTFLLDGPAVLGGGQLGLSWDWLAVELSVLGTSGGSSNAAVDAFALTAAAGIVPLSITQGSLSASLGLFVEGGLLVSDAQSRVRGYVGATQVAPLVGGLVRLSGELALERAVRVIVNVEVGYTHGVEVLALETTALRVHGPWVGLGLGLAFTP